MASLLYGLAGTLLKELFSPLIQYYVGLPWKKGSEDEFEKLKDTLSAIKAVLLDAEDRQENSHQIRDWLMKIKLVFYDVEDLLQKVTRKALKYQVMTKNKLNAKEVRIFFSRDNEVNSRLKMGRKVKLIRERLDAIALNRNMFNFTERQEDMSVFRSNRRDETHSFVPLEKFIGRDEDKKYVTQLLLESNDALDNVSVISIIGIGGLGKTTLAQSIYSSEEFKGNFERMIWVCVSDVFDVKVICEKIVESATKEKCERLQMDVVKDKLKEVIDGRKYLLVLDDVWNECPNAWMELEVLLTGGARGSKILITARAELVARAAESIATHVLKGLSHEDSWVLFRQVAFKRGVERESPTIVGIGKEVVEKCVGVPLVIKTIGSMLGIKKKEIEWLNFKKNDLPLITRDSEGKVLPILKLSYNYLSAPLKRCFVYCAIFPKDYKIQKEALIRMWMALGLIQLDGTSRSLEDVGEQHFSDLLDRSLFEVEYDEDNDDVIEFYKMHDLIHDLALSLGDNEYYNLCSNMNNIDKTTRHAWVTGHVSTNLLHAKNLRTLVVEDRNMINEIKSISKQLRVLVLGNLKMESMPRFVDGLRHLYYLDLSRNDFDSLPESICSLYNLQTLKLQYCSKLKELPKGTRNLVSLSHLDIKGCNELKCMPSGLGELTCLQTLSHFVLGTERSNCCQLCELKSLVNLRGKLVIKRRRGSNVVKCKREQSCSPYPLTHLEFVQHLILGEAEFEEEEEEEEEEEAAKNLLLLLESLKPHPSLEKLEIYHWNRFKRFPSWMDKINIGISLPNIVFIKLDARNSSLEHLPPFGLLPSLRELHLQFIGGVEYIYKEEERGDEEEDCNNNNHESLGAFPSLKTLILKAVPQLTSLVGPTSTTRRHFPVLEKLTIWDCPKLLVNEDVTQFQRLTALREVTLQDEDTETLPAWLQFLPHLQILEVSWCEKIVSLPEWMGNLTSLHEIRLEFCSSLASIPDCMRRLTSLQQLEVWASDKLLGRCEKETGEDWHKIAHIPNVWIY